MLFALFLGVIFFSAMIGVYCFLNAGWWRVTEAEAPAVMITVEDGATFSDVAKQLQEKGVANAFWIRVHAKLFGAPDLHPGSYSVLVGSSYHGVLTILSQVQSSVVRVTIPEGFSLSQMGERIHAALPAMSVQDWMNATSATSPLSRDSFVIAAGKPSGVDLEGYLFPDTYEFEQTATAEDVAERMLRTMESRMTSIGAASGDASGMTVHEVLTLASIVEKEVRTPETMKNVADIFLKRLDIGMALQSDATINYVIGGDDPSPTYADLEVDSPYNTYKNAGLPPGPIAAPGLNALTAVLRPIHNEYFYFLTTDDGRIYYAETYDEHLRNKAKWL
jgi:UPF0755 protein